MFSSFVVSVNAACNWSLKTKVNFLENQFPVQSLSYGINVRKLNQINFIKLTFKVIIINIWTESRCAFFNYYCCTMTSTDINNVFLKRHRFIIYCINNFLISIIRDVIVKKFKIKTPCNPKTYYHKLYFYTMLFVI